MNTLNKNLVIFDFDGVLVDTLEMLFSINQEVNEDFSLEEYKSLFEGNIYSSLRKDGKPKNTHPDFFNLYDSNSREMVVPEILKSVVTELNKNYILIIISSTNTDSIKKILERENILNCFSEVLGADIEKSKVIKINSILSKYQISSSDSVFITDTLGDIREGLRCGVNSIAVSWGFHDKNTLQKGDPIAIVDDPRDLLQSIENVLK